MTPLETSLPAKMPLRRQAMRAALLSRPRHIELVQLPLPEPGAGQIRVRLEGCGVCASNIPLWEGKPWFQYPLEPGAPGHEGWGRVDAVGSRVNDFAVGDRVAFLSSHAYAEYDIADAEAALKLPSGLDAIPFPGEPLGCAMNILARSRIGPGDDVAIVGIGFLGALLTRLAYKAGARVIAVSRRNASLALARAMGAAECLSFGDPQGAIQAVHTLTGGRFCDVVIEATGKQAPLDFAAEITRERGRLVIAGYHQDGPRQVNMQLWNWRGLDVVNAHERDPKIYLEGMHAALHAVQSGQIDPTPLYTHRFPLERLGEALEMTAQCPDGFIKALITMQP